MDKLSEVAAAICAVSGTVNWDVLPEHDENGISRDYFREQARAAVVTLQAPNSAMKDNLLAQFEADVTISNAKAAAWDACRGYRFLLDAVIDEGN
ncbi:hypothetical protein ACFOY8_14675 [Thalassospira xianhensis]|uniref:Uncharacterized protein n=1 Tax=Thalassospira xianhensis MCCC 1A02616 TaxID=1177929 RepID=A0A367UH24_9PROT|nr:hypothetical protein [Thalassospira xianhensis]RCK07606.1 hypothetical protein TH5_00560 [Thalassospira xianhensis MCCC 1A02616]